MAFYSFLKNIKRTFVRSQERHPAAAAAAAAAVIKASSPPPPAPEKKKRYESTSEESVESVKQTLAQRQAWVDLAIAQGAAHAAWEEYEARHKPLVGLGPFRTGHPSCDQKFDSSLDWADHGPLPYDISTSSSTEEQDCTRDSIFMEKTAGVRQERRSHTTRHSEGIFFFEPQDPAGPLAEIDENDFARALADYRDDFDREVNQWRDKNR